MFNFCSFIKSGNSFIANAINKFIWYEINSNLLYKFNFFNENFKVEHVYKTT